MNSKAHPVRWRPLPPARKFTALLLTFYFLTFSVSACLPVSPDPLPPTDTLIPSPSIPPSPTVIWFPPTATATPLPTIETTPTQAAGIQYGALLLEDDFDNASLWSRELSQRGTISLTGGELSIVLVEPRAYLASVRSEPDLRNYYAEITASPSLCRGQDEYGLLFHYQSQVDFYRFSLSCNGQLRLDRLVGGTAASPQPWLPSAMVPSAAPSQTELGVWVQGETMRFYLNGELQFEAQDAYLRYGRLGVFARSSGETAVTVSFSDLRVYQIEP